MKNIIKVGVALSALATLAAPAIAAGPITGVWHGHISFDRSKLPATSDPAKQKAMLAQIKGVEQVKFTLTLKSDHTFTITSVGGAKPLPNATGTYTQTGSTLTITPVRNGKSTPTQTFNISKDGHSFTFSQQAVSITFAR